VATEARRAGCDVETDPRVVCTLLAGMIRQCDAAGAERHFARCVRHGLQPNQDVYTSLCRALGKGGWVEQAVTAYYNGARAAGAHPDQSPSAVSAVLGACARAGDADLALRLFSELRPHSPALRNPEPYIALLQALARDRFKPGGCVADRTDRGERALSLARDSGVDIDGRCLNALLLCYVHASDAPGAIAACTRWAHPPIRADDATLLRLLEACVRDRRPDLLPDVTRIAAAHKLSFGPAARDLQLRARLAGIGRRPRAAGDEEADLEAALREFDTGGGTGWSFRTRSELAVACARHGRVEAAALLLDQMAERGEEPGPQVEAALMEAYYRAGDVDPEPMVLWRRGARVAGAARAHGTAREGGSRTPGRGRRRGWWGDEEAGVGLVF
jgi:pentatricopeptide repeat protein